MSIDQLRSEVRNLSMSDRVTLVRELIDSLDGSTLKDIEAEWGEVALARSRAYDAGETTARDWREALQEILDRLPKTPVGESSK